MTTLAPVYVRLYQDGSTTRLERVDDHWQLTSTNPRGKVECRHRFSGIVTAVQASVDAMMRRAPRTAWIQIA
jgi:hypothetical protein